LQLKATSRSKWQDSQRGLIRDGKAVSYGIQGAEKSYADFDLVATDPGGHSSRPTPDNPIYRMARAMVRISEYRFPVMSNEITRGAFAAAAGEYPGEMGAAMKRFAADPADAAAIATLETELSNVGMLRTTCVATMQGGGHAPNALPQRATAVVNCRIFPGTPAESVRQTLASVIADPDVSITRRNDGALDSPASTLRPDVMAAVKRSIHAIQPPHPDLALDVGGCDRQHVLPRGRRAELRALGDVLAEGRVLRARAEREVPRRRHRRRAGAL
jgi:acetylornithine deacetylase/succinyl-diaminopimelate desuccinylase-like protein